MLVFYENNLWGFMWKIKNVEINGKIVVAPMAGISNMTFRRICKSMGASLVVAEMVSDKAITYGNEKLLNFKNE